MNHTEAVKYLKRAEKNGYVRYHSGLVAMEQGSRTSWGINIDGDGHDGRLFGSPRIIWSKEEAEEMFPKTVKHYDVIPEEAKQERHDRFLADRP